MDDIRKALAEVDDMIGINSSVAWTLEDIAYQELDDPMANGWTNTNTWPTDAA